MKVYIEKVLARLIKYNCTIVNDNRYPGQLKPKLFLLTGISKNYVNDGYCKTNILFLLGVSGLISSVYNFATLWAIGV